MESHSGVIIKYLIGTNMDGSFHDNLMLRHLPEGTKEIHEKAGSVAAFREFTSCSSLSRCTYQLYPFFRYKSKPLVEAEVTSYSGHSVGVF